MTRRTQHGSQPESNPYLQAGLATGYICRRTEEELQRIGAATGGLVPARTLGEWLGRFFLSQSQKNPDGLDFDQYVSQMRPDPAQGYALGAGETQIHVRPRHQRPLSAAARAAIAAAQRRRWQKQKTQAVKHSTLDPQLIARLKKLHAAGTSISQIARDLGIGYNTVQKYATGKVYVYPSKPKLKPGQTANPSQAMKGFWAKLTPEQRSAEMMRRRQVAEGKLAAPAPRKSQAKAGTPKIVEKGFWLKQVTELLKQRPRPQREVYNTLVKRYPDKENAISVALPTAKRRGDVVIVDGLMTLPKANGAAATA